MANVYATKTGNWSDTTVWNTGSLPTSADDVYSNTFTVTIDQNVTVQSIRNTAATGITAGGGFACSSAQTITATSTGIVAGTSTCLTCSNGTGVTVIINANIANTSSGIGILITGNSGTVNITGNLSTTSSGPACRMNGTLTTLSITGNITQSAAGINGPIGTLDLLNSGTVNVTGNVSTTVSATNVGAINFFGGTSNAVLTVTGSLTSGNSNSAAAIFGSAPNVTLIGTLTANAACVGTPNAGHTWYVSGPFICSSSGLWPINTASSTSGTSYVKLIPVANNEFRFAKSGGGTSSLYSSDVTSGAPTAANVRSGVSYGGGTLVGTLKVPNPSYVALGVETDNTVGSLAYNSDSAIAAALWNTQTSALTTSGSIGERLKNAATVDTTGAQIASYGA